MIKTIQKTQQQNAFTLVELLIVVAIIGVLASVAYPSYQNIVIETRRDDAKAALLGFANAMERYFNENNTYLNAAGTNLVPLDSGAPRIYSQTSPLDGSVAYYNLTISAAPAPTATTYTLTATPIGAQAGDGILVINNTESRGRWDRNNDGDTLDANEGNWDNNL